MTTGTQACFQHTEHWCAFLCWYLCCFMLPRERDMNVNVHVHVHVHTLHANGCLLRCSCPIVSIPHILCFPRVHHRGAREREAGTQAGVWWLQHE